MINNWIVRSRFGIGLWAALLVLMTTAFLGQGAAAATDGRWFDGLLRGPEVALTQPLAWRAALNQTLTPASADTKARVLEAFGRRPLHFEPNQGQTDPAVKFLARAPGYQLLLTSNEAVLAVRGQTAEQSAVVRMQLMGEGVNPQPVVEGLAALPGHSNYYLGNDPQRWQTEVPHFAKVRYGAVYPGVDWELYGNPRQLEYDFVVAPGADPQQIAVNFAGAEAMRLDANGELAITVAGREVLHSSPTIYQVVNGERQIVAGGYVLRESAGDAPVVGFEIAAYDRQLPLVIDPLVYFTFVGGAPDDNTLVGGDDYGYAVAVDAAGVAYITGSTSTNNANIKGLTTRFPITSIRLNPDFSGGTDAFVTRMDAAGTIIYSTYFGGNAYESGYGIAVDGVGNAYITGYTNSDDFPLVIRTNADSVNESGSTVAIVTNSPLPVATPGNFYSVTFTATAPTGATFSWALENLSGVPAGFLLTTAGVLSGNPTANDAGVYNFIIRLTSTIPGPTGNVTSTIRKTFQLRVRGATALQGTQDAFVARINASGTFGYSTYLGGTGNEAGYGIAVDTLGQAYVTGYTSSANAGTNPVNNFPGANFPGITTRPSAVGEDTFIVKVAADGSSLIYSTLTGAAGNDRGQGIVLDAAGTSAYITGFRTNAANEAAFISKVDPTGAISYSAALNGPGNERGLAIARDDATGVYITGYTSSASGIATTGAYDTTFNGPAASTDAFLAKYRDTGNELEMLVQDPDFPNDLTKKIPCFTETTDTPPVRVSYCYATYLGGYANDVGYGITVDSFGNAYVAGETFSPNFPMVSPDDSLWAKGEAFLSRLNADDASADPPINAGSILTYSSFWGGAENDSGRGIAKDFSNNVYMVGYTNSPNAGFTFGPITPYRSYSGGADAFAAKFSIPVVNTEFSLAVQLQGSGSGAVTSVPQGIGQTAACQLVNGILDPNADCDASYPTGTSVTLTAAPSVGAVLVGWSGSGSGTCAGTSTLTCVVAMGAAKTVVANFALAKNLTVSKEGTGSGTVTSSPAGIAITCDPTCSSATFPFPTSTVVTLTAAVKTESGSTFAGWSGADDCNGSTSTTCQVTIGPADKNVTATFTGVATNLLAVFTAGLGTGTVTSTPTGINCGGSCTEASPATFNFPATTPITLTATPNIDSVFVKWTGACTGSALTCDVTVSTAKTVRAEFSLPYQVNVTVGGSGSVTSNPTGINGCTTNPATDPAKCSSGFADGTWVTLTATPGSGYVFTDWQGTCSTQVSQTSPICQISVFGIRNITASFSPSAKLTVQTAGNGTGTVASTLPDNEINCISGTTTGVCTKDYPLGIKVTLTATATADTGSTFAGWSGDACVGVIAPTCVVTMNNAKMVKATFNPKSYLLTVRTGAGTVTSSPAGISCGTACTASYVQGTTVILTAVPNTGFMFAGWSGDCSGLTPSCVVTMTAAMNVAATFSISTLPDLIVPALSTPAVGIPNTGRTVSFALQVKNQGNTAAGAFRVGLYLSKDQIITPKDINTGNQCQFSSLAAGVTAPCSSTFNLPQGLVSGVYYLGAYADPYNAIQESKKTNNSQPSVNTLTAYTLKITKTGTGSGTVTSVPSGITCGVGANCTAAFLAGATATLIAAPAANSALVSWTGCTPTLGKPTQCTVLMNATKAVTANFGPGFKLTVVKIGTGTVNSAAVGINCGTICTAQVLKNRIVSLTAAPATGWQFAGWIGCTAASGATCSVTMSTAKTVTATFKPKLTVIKTGSGTVTSVPAGINCGTVCIAPFNLNSVVTLTAKPITGQQLKRWVGCTTTTGATCTVNMTAAKTVQANFGL